MAMALAQLDITREGTEDVESAVPDYPREDIIYDEVPEGMIDLPSAVRKYGINRGTLRRWVLSGHLRRAGRVKGAAPGGGFVLLWEDEFIAWINSPRLPGRPKTRHGKGSRRTRIARTT